MTAATAGPAIKVLVVDDEPQIVRALRINLTARGYHVLTAPDRRETLRRLDETFDALAWRAAA